MTKGWLYYHKWLLIRWYFAQLDHQLPKENLRKYKINSSRQPVSTAIKIEKSKKKKTRNQVFSTNTFIHDRLIERKQFQLIDIFKLVLVDPIDHLVAYSDNLLLLQYNFYGNCSTGKTLFHQSWEYRPLSAGSGADWCQLVNWCTNFTAHNKCSIY